VIIEEDESDIEGEADGTGVISLQNTLATSELDSGLPTLIDLLVLENLGDVKEGHNTYHLVMKVGSLE
jgi:hypothetical protein